MRIAPQFILRMDPAVLGVQLKLYRSGQGEQVLTGGTAVS
jgi:hypothetical protein